MRRLLLFPVLYCIAYVMLYALNIIVVLYYPEANAITRRPRPPNFGPGMLYYGWVSAALVAAAASFLVPERWVARVPSAVSWVFPALALVYVIYHERGWLFP